MNFEGVRIKTGGLELVNEFKEFINIGNWTHIIEILSTKLLVLHNNFHNLST